MKFFFTYKGHRNSHSVSEIGQKHVSMEEVCTNENSSVYFLKLRPVNLPVTEYRYPKHTEMENYTEHS